MLRPAAGQLGSGVGQVHGKQRRRDHDIRALRHVRRPRQRHRCAYMGTLVDVYQRAEHARLFFNGDNFHPHVLGIVAPYAYGYYTRRVFYAYIRSAAAGPRIIYVSKFKSRAFLAYCPTWQHLFLRGSIFSDVAAHVALAWLIMSCHSVWRVLYCVAYYTRIYVGFFSKSAYGATMVLGGGRKQADAPTSSKLRGT